MTTHENARAALTQKRQALLGRWQAEMADEAELLAWKESDWEDRAAVERDARVLDRLGEDAVAELSLVVEALRRLDAGTYGTCGDCGDKVAEARLAVLPEAEFCTECATRREETAN